MHWHPGYLKYLRFFVKKSSLPFFLPCLSNSSRCSYVICLTLALIWFLISALSSWHFSTSCNTLWNSMDEMCPSCIACEMILAMLSNLLWASSLKASCFSCFTVRVLKDFVHIPKLNKTKINTKGKYR